MIGCAITGVYPNRKGKNLLESELFVIFGPAHQTGIALIRNLSRESTLHINPGKNRLQRNEGWTDADNMFTRFHLITLTSQKELSYLQGFSG